MMRPNLFIVGQPKSGTTALHAFLAKQPGAWMCMPKEPHFFCTDLHEASDRFHGHTCFYPVRDPDTYLRLFAPGPDARVVGEASTEYLFSSKAADAIQTFNSSARIVIVLRDPAEFIASLHATFLNDFIEDEPDLVRAFQRPPDAPPAHARTPGLLHYPSRLTYHTQVSRYLDRFAPGQVLILLYEDFRDAPDATLRRLLTFLGLDAPTHPIALTRENERQSPRSPHLARVAFAPRVLFALRRSLPPRLHAAASRFAKRLLFAPTPARPAPEGFREMVWDSCRTEVDQLSERLQIDLGTRWNAP